MPNIVYVLTNPAMPGFVKIGMTDKPDVQIRMRELYGTGLPLPFECFTAREIEDRNAQEVEAALHRAFDPYRVNPSREFFKIEPEQAEAVLSVMAGRDVTPNRTEQDSALESEDREALVTFKKRQSKTTEDDFMAALTGNGARVYSQVLALGSRERLQVKWGEKGFSLNVSSNKGPIVVCYGFPPSAYDQRIYTGLQSAGGKGGVPKNVIDELRDKAFDTGLFEIAGRGLDLRCDTNRDLEDNQISVLIDFLCEVIGTIRQYDQPEPAADQVTE